MNREDTIAKYGDIIYMDRPWPEVTARRHPKMSVQDRAKIFAPFAALTGHSSRLSQEDRKLMRTKRLEFSDEDMVKLSDKLLQVAKGMTVSVLYFAPEGNSDKGFYRQIEGAVVAVDLVYQTLRINNTTIPFGDVADISGEGIICFNPDLDDCQ